VIVPVTTGTNLNGEEEKLVRALRGPFLIRSNMFKYLVFFSAIGIALVAAYFSVTGIATLFAGKFFAVVAMAGALEIAKLVAASFLYRYWKTTAAALKTYLIIGVAVLMVITSIGIYGYLSAAYAEVAAAPQTTINQISFADTRQASLNETIQRLQTDNVTINTRQAQAQTSLDNVLAGQTDLSQRSAFANLRQEIADLDVERQANNGRIESAITERDSLENVKVTLNAELNTNSEIGTFIYIARILGLPLDTVVKWFVLIIVFVFDPMAISLILAYNSMIMKEKRQRGSPPKKDKKVMKVFDWDEDDFREELKQELEQIEQGPDPKTHAETLRRADEVYRNAKRKPFSELTKNWPDERKAKVDKRIEDIFDPQLHDGFVPAEFIINKGVNSDHAPAEYPIVPEQQERPSHFLYKAKVILHGTRYGQVVDVIEDLPGNNVVCVFEGHRFSFSKDNLIKITTHGD